MREIRFENNDNEKIRAICRGVIPSLPTFEYIRNGPSQGSVPSQGSGPSQGCGPSQASGSKEKWTKGKIAMARSLSKEKLSKEKLINRGKPNSEKHVDDNKCPWVVLVSKIKNTETWQEFNNEAYEWLNQIPPQHWSRSHFLVRAKSDVLLNNMCEVFNGKLVAGRDRPIIATLEFAREYLMKRIVNVNKLIDRCDGPLTPTATKIWRSNSNEARKYTVDYAGDDLYQSKKKASTQAARSVTSTDKGKAPTGSQSKNKGKAPATIGVPKKIAPRKKIIKLG
ncbi:hypothetical protein Tco_1186684 [Tanacetum coccineum]